MNCRNYELLDKSMLMIVLIYELGDFSKQKWPTINKSERNIRDDLEFLDGTSTN